MLPDGIKPLPEPALTYHKWCPVALTWRIIIRISEDITTQKVRNFKIAPTSPRDKWVKYHKFRFPTNFAMASNASQIPAPEVALVPCTCQSRCAHSLRRSSFVVISEIVKAWGMSCLLAITTRGTPRISSWLRTFCSVSRHSARRSTSLLSTTKKRPEKVKQHAGPRFNIKMPSYRNRKSHCGDKTAVRSSYLHNGISYTGKMPSLYWISPQVSIFMCILYAFRKLKKWLWYDEKTNIGVLLYCYNRETVKIAITSIIFFLCVLQITQFQFMKMHLKVSFAIFWPFWLCWLGNQCIIGEKTFVFSTWDSNSVMGLLPDTQTYGLRMRRGCRERFPTAG